jgi:hypothetical protein
MAGPFLFDRVKETSTTTGTGTLTLAGAVSNFQAFSVVGDGNTCYYAIVHRTIAEWEVGVGTYTASGTTLARTSVLASSNSGLVVTLQAGTKDVFITAPATLLSNISPVSYTYEAAGLEPLAIEVLQSGTYTYAINSTTTKLVVNAYLTQLAGAGRWEIRDPRRTMPLRNVTVTGTGAGSTGIFIDPTLPTYANAQATYYDRLSSLATLPTKYLSIGTAGTRAVFLPGPYGNIITSVNVFDATWVVIRPFGTTLGWNLHDEVGDAASEAINFAHPTLIPVSKLVCWALELGTQRTAGNAEGSITYVICPSTWGKVTDSNTYLFRDDFTGDTLDTGATWTRSQSSAGNVEIDTNFAWLKLIGDGNWGANGCFSQTTTARNVGKKFQCDVYVPVISSLNHNYLVGWHDGAGQSFSDFAHGMYFTNSGGVRRLQVFEDNNSRGLVGANPGFTEGYIYRVRITLGASSATYEIQGGPEYDQIGGATWDDVTPGVTSSTTTPLAIGATREQATGTVYVGDMRMYT